MESEIDSYKDQAHLLVDAVITNAIKKLEAEKLLEHLSRGSTPHEYSRVQNEPYEMKDIDWLNIEQFSVEAATDKINEFIKTWQYKESWLYCVDYLGADDHEFDTRHRFRVRWSIPTRRKPIPRGTASVYFTFQVSKIKPQDYPVEVFYVFETNRLVHKPGSSRFREKWLKDIIESKVQLLECMEF